MGGWYNALLARTALPVSGLWRTRLNGRMPNRSTTDPPRTQPARAVSLATLFVSFLTIGSTSFGGGLTGWIRRELVEKRRWLDDQQFLSCYALSQMVPGATNVNLAVLIGTQLRGAIGAATAVAGLLLVPLAILMTLGSFYFAARGAPGGRLLNLALAGAGAAAIGFNIATGIRLARHNVRRLGPALIAAAIIVGIGILRIPLLEVLLVMLPASLALTLLERAR
jgi:chromate transporter